MSLEMRQAFWGKVVDSDSIDGEDICGFKGRGSVVWCVKVSGAEP